MKSILCVIEESIAQPKEIVSLTQWHFIWDPLYLKIGPVTFVDRRWSRVSIAKVSTGLLILFNKCFFRVMQYNFNIVITLIFWPGFNGLCGLVKIMWELCDMDFFMNSKAEQNNSNLTENKCDRQPFFQSGCPMRCVVSFLLLYVIVVIYYENLYIQFSNRDAWYFFSV